MSYKIIFARKGDCTEINILRINIYTLSKRDDIHRCNMNIPFCSIILKLLQVNFTFSKDNSRTERNVLGHISKEHTIYRHLHWMVLSMFCDCLHLPLKATFNSLDQKQSSTRLLRNLEIAGKEEIVVCFEVLLFYASES